MSKTCPKNVNILFRLNSSFTRALSELKKNTAMSQKKQQTLVKLGDYFSKSVQTFSNINQSYLNQEKLNVLYNYL